MIYWQRAASQEKGILVGCDRHQEWLLPWWWKHYSVDHAFPVTFADFGMSEEARAWCMQHGEVMTVDVDTSFIIPPQAVSSAKKERWEKLYGGSFWHARNNWFKKPFACLRSPYAITIWIDLDCEIIGKLDDLFSRCTVISELALVREVETEHYSRWDKNTFYNGGVMVFVHGCSIMMQWAEGCIRRNGEFLFDDNLLSALISEQRLEIVELPVEYNWKFLWGINMNAEIVHWVGKLGKDFIKRHGGIKQSFQKIVAQDS